MKTTPYPVPDHAFPCRMMAPSGFIALFSLVWTCQTLAADTPPVADPSYPVSVGVFAQHSGSKIVYHYRVTNNTQQEISAVSIGHDNNNDIDPVNDVYELSELPSGWNPRFGIPSANSNAPTGWRVSMDTVDSDATDKSPDKPLPADQSSMQAVKPHAITWQVMNDKSPKLLPGQSMSKMSITLDNADTSYLTGHALITFGEGDLVNMTVPIDRLDNLPPSLFVNPSPGTIPASDTKPVPVKTTFIINDDYDRQPEIKLESITANEPLEPGDVLDASIGRDDRYLKLKAISKTPAGRTYTITYSATDASGNQTLASADVKVVAADSSTPPGSVPPLPVQVPPVVEKPGTAR